MKTTITIAAGLVLLGFLGGSAYAGPADGQLMAQGGANAKATPPQKGLSKRNRAVIEKDKAAKMRQDKIASEAAGNTVKKKELSERNKARLRQAEASRKMHEEMQSNPDPSTTK